LRHVNKKKFRAVIFRRTYPQVTNPGGLWDESTALYSQLPGTTPRKNDLTWSFSGGARLKFAHLQHEGDEYNWQGAQICFIGFDELTHFSEQQFFYMLSRNRSLSGVRPYVRATTNPDADSWVAKMIDWWIDDNGYPIPERGGVVRYFVRVENVMHWADTAHELIDRFGEGTLPKSFTFIPSSVFDNKILMEADPGYLANLQAQTLVEQERLLHGNWRVRPEAGKVFNRTWFEIIHQVRDAGKVCRFFDFAATEKKIRGADPDYTATVRMRKDDNIYVVEHAEQRRLAPPDIDAWMRELAEADRAELGPNTQYILRWEMEPGSAGIRENYRLVTDFAGFDSWGDRPSGDKLTRAKALSAQARVGNVKILNGKWNEVWLTHMHHQPDWPHDDLMDASSGAFNALLGARRAGTWGT
jgi:predicted phage terminase large subunit-like protein